MVNVSININLTNNHF